MKQFHRLLCVAKNCDWLRKFTPASSVASLGMKPSTNLEKNAGKIKSVFDVDAALKIAGVGKLTLSVLSLG